MDRILHAYFSAEAAYLYGSSYYRRADGSKVEITCVGEDRQWIEEHYQWKDKRYLGVCADEWLGKAKQGITPDYPYMDYTYIPE